MDVDALSNSHKLRAVVLTWLSLVLAFGSLIFGAYNFFIYNETLLASCHLVFSFYSFYLYFLAKQFRHSYRSIIVFTSMLAFIISLATSILPFENAIFVWGSFVPVFFYLLLGTKQGCISTVVFFLIQTAIITTKASFESASSNSMLVLNITACYLAVWVTAHIFESNRKKAETSLSLLASKDSLTNTYNRLALTHQFPSLQRTANAPLSLLILDIDFFKQVNDRFGHSTGDKVLIEVAKLLRDTIGEDQVFRIGGEEFCLTLPHTDLVQAERYAEAIREKVASHSFTALVPSINVTVSIGVCECNPVVKLEDVLIKADVELYRAKKNGRNQVMVCSEQKHSALSSVPLAAKLD
ncbi:GGDEF domain-containing protein [Vibrio sp. YMD68]|uniref:GGDEF domain-containing protein n=1 Tax=Vibrio sp. YMD68 TaxID=3042300 RepID=UPI00249C6B77|nr:GGDEF domain-containing protein [Vibrio sp. YMD68]WGW01751.1 GGDEF domain-containing protein [Vibrio sp. YMD68]